MKKIITFAGILLCSCAVGAVEIQLSANEVIQGDSLSLRITDSKPIGQVDLSALNKDFILGGQQYGQSSRFVNGVGSTTYELGVILFPTKSGQLQIPALKVGNEMTKPLTLKVNEQSVASNTGEQNQADIKLSASVSDNHPYVGQSLFYKVELTDNVGILGGEVIPNPPDKVNMIPMGQDTEKRSVQNGRMARVIERTYRVVPQESGTLMIQPAVFNGEVPYRHQNRRARQPLFGVFDGADLFQNFMTTTRPVQIISNPVELQVKAPPADWTGWWLPSSDVQLNVSYQKTDELKMGDTIQGELTLTALDVDANDMPVAKLPPQNDFRVYPEPEERITQMTPDGHLKGIVKSKFALMPLKEGTLEIPAVEVPWLNTRTEKKDLARIEAYPLYVHAGENVLPVLAPAQPVRMVEKTPPPQVQDHFWSGILWGVSIGLIFFGLSGGIVWLIYRRKKTIQKEKKKPIPDFYPF